MHSSMNERIMDASSSCTVREVKLEMRNVCFYSLGMILMEERGKLGMAPYLYKQ